MPQTAYDPVAGILAKAPTPNALRASAWDAFHDARDEDDLATKLGDLSLPDSVKADLWDLKATGRTKPVSAEDFMPPPAQGSAVHRFLSNAADLFNPVTMAKGLATTAADSRPEDAALGPAAVLAPFIRDAAHAQADEAARGIAAARSGDYMMAGSHALAAATPLIGPAAGAARDQMASGDVAGGAGRAAGLMAATAFGDPLQAGAREAVPRLATIGEQIASKTATKVGPVARRAIAEAKPFIVPAMIDTALHFVGSPPLATAAKFASKILAKSLESAKAAANTGGKMVEAGSPSLDSVITDALDELRTPEPPAKITTPPEPALPAGYVPRSTVPKPKATKPTATAATDTAPAPPQRAYFLKPLSEMQAAGPVRVERPSGSITPADLPESWRSRIGQDVIPTTGAEGKATLDALQQEIKDSGVSIGQAIVAVSKNKALPPQIRAQLLKALSKTGSR